MNTDRNLLEMWTHNKHSVHHYLRFSLMTVITHPVTELIFWQILPGKPSARVWFYNHLSIVKHHQLCIFTPDEGQIVDLNATREELSVTRVFTQHKDYRFSILTLGGKLHGTLSFYFCVLRLHTGLPFASILISKYHLPVCPLKGQIPDQCESSKERESKLP